MDPIQYLKMTLAALGVRFDADDQRIDDKYTAILARELEYVRARTYDVVYPEKKARRLIPVDSSVPAGARTITYDQWDAFGMAVIVSNYADDLPMVDVMKEQFSSVVQSIADAYQWSTQDLEEAAMVPGARLNQRRAGAARLFIENRFEDIAAFGASVGGLKGLLNHPNVALVAPTTGTWSTATAEQMVDDAGKLVQAVVDNTEETFLPNTLVMDSVNKGRMANKKMVNTDTTALKWFLDNNEYINSVETWYKCKLADAASTGPRICCYKKDPIVLELVIPMEFRQQPPQPRNLSFVVPCQARIGGVTVYYPLAIAYMDGL